MPLPTGYLLPKFRPRLPHHGLFLYPWLNSERLRRSLGPGMLLGRRGAVVTARPLETSWDRGQSLH